jgi:hypothetical protein
MSEMSRLDENYQLLKEGLVQLSLSFPFFKHIAQNRCNQCYLHIFSFSFGSGYHHYFLRPNRQCEQKLFEIAMSVHEPMFILITDMKLIANISAV